MLVTAVHFRSEISLAVPGGDETDVVTKWNIYTRSRYDYTWELEFIPTLRMLAVTAVYNGHDARRETTYVPMENVASMRMAMGDHRQGGVSTSPPKK